MISALATVTFLATLWLLVVVGAAVLEESGARIAAALKGASFASAPARMALARMAPPRMAALRLRARPGAGLRGAPAKRAAPRLRVAA